jgi:hypothetical protein
MVEHICSSRKKKDRSRYESKLCDVRQKDLFGSMTNEMNI